MDVCNGSLGRALVTPSGKATTMGVLGAGSRLEQGTSVDMLRAGHGHTSHAPCWFEGLCFSQVVNVNTLSDSEDIYWSRNSRSCLY